MAKASPKKLTTTVLVQAVADAVGEDISRKTVKALFDALTAIGPQAYYEPTLARAQ